MLDENYPRKFLVFLAICNDFLTVKCLVFFMGFRFFFFYWLLYNPVIINGFVLFLLFSTIVTNTPSSLTFCVMFCDCCKRAVK